jgi:DNA polymerase III subunit epsilon
VAALVEHRYSGGTAREKLYTYLERQVAGAHTEELVGLLFAGAGSDPELGPRIVHRLLAGDPNFIFDPQTGMWALRASEVLKVPLDRGRYVVVDLETTGGRPGPGAIIEIGAYRMEGPRMTESFATLVRPRGLISPFVMRLTTITNEMVAGAPPIESVLPAFRDFLGDAVMVAHNAHFDFAFLDFEFRRLFGMGLKNPVLCTLRLARRFVPSLRRRRLDALAEHFGLSTAGRHRGLSDARMAAELLSIFLDIAAQSGITRVDRLIDLHSRGAAGRRIERHVPPDAIAALPMAPGVYLMRNERGDLLYVGKARRLRERVASYFNGGITMNAKTADLVSHVYTIDARVTPSALDAALLEARLIRELKPPYNRMLKGMAQAYFVRLDLMDAFPRLKLSTKLSARRGVMQLGPFVGRGGVDRAVRALGRILGMRTCAGKLAPREDFSPCMYGQMGHCAMPCNLRADEDAYGTRVRRAVEFLRGRTGPLLGELARARDDAARAMRFEEAARFKRELTALTTLASRAERLSRVVTENNLVIVVGADASILAHVVLSGRLAMTRPLAEAGDAQAVAEFVAANYERYRARPVARDEIDATAITARWLSEREGADGRLIHLRGPNLDPATLWRPAGAADRAESRTHE